MSGLPNFFKRRPAFTLRAFLGLAVFVSGAALAQSQQKGDATLRVEYQYIRNGAFQGDGFTADYWTTDTHVALLSGDYALSDRWTVYAALPYVQKRFNADPNDPYGGDPHNPNDPWWIDFVPPDKRFVDDGDFHGGLQDLSVGLSYLALDGPLTVSPYIAYGFPADNYPFYAKAAIGTNLWNLPVGVSLSYVPYFSDWFFNGDLAYVFSEKPLGVNVDYWLGFLSAGYWFKPRFSVSVFYPPSTFATDTCWPAPILASSGTSITLRISVRASGGTTTDCSDTVSPTPASPSTIF